MQRATPTFARFTLIAPVTCTAMAVDAWGNDYADYTDPNDANDHSLWCHVGDRPTYVLGFTTGNWTC